MIWISLVRRKKKKKSKKIFDIDEAEENIKSSIAFLLKVKFDPLERLPMADVSPSLFAFLIKDLVTTVKVVFLALCLTRYFKGM